MTLPTPHLLPKRDFGGQRFVRTSRRGEWLPWRAKGFEMRDTASRATMATPAPGGGGRDRAEAKFGAHGGSSVLLSAAGSGVDVQGTGGTLKDDSCVIPATLDYALNAGGQSCWK